MSKSRSFTVHNDQQHRTVKINVPNLLAYYLLHVNRFVLIFCSRTVPYRSKFIEGARIRSFRTIETRKLNWPPQHLKLPICQIWKILRLSPFHVALGCGPDHGCVRMWTLKSNIHDIWIDSITLSHCTSVTSLFLMICAFLGLKSSVFVIRGARRIEWCAEYISKMEPTFPYCQNEGKKVAQKHWLSATILKGSLYLHICASSRTQFLFHCAAETSNPAAIVKDCVLFFGFLCQQNESVFFFHFLYFRFDWSTLLYWILLLSSDWTGQWVSTYYPLVSEQIIRTRYKSTSCQLLWWLVEHKPCFTMQLRWAIRRRRYFFVYVACCSSASSVYRMRMLNVSPLVLQIW